MADPTPRTAALLFSEAIEHIDSLEPPAVRAPIRDMFRAEIERCALSRSLLGQPVNYMLELAEAIVGEPKLKTERMRHG
jgi:hypothetical protein